MSNDASGVRCPWCGCDLLDQAWRIVTEEDIDLNRYECLTGDECDECMKPIEWSVRVSVSVEPVASDTDLEAAGQLALLTPTASVPTMEAGDV